MSEGRRKVAISRLGGNVQFIDKSCNIYERKRCDLACVSVPFAAVSARSGKVSLRAARLALAYSYQILQLRLHLARGFQCRFRSYMTELDGANDDTFPIECEVYQAV